MTIREAVDADLDAIEALATLYRSEATSWLAPATGEGWRDLWRPLQELGGVVLLAEDEHGLCGLLALAPVRHPLLGYTYAECLAWYVLPQRRGGLVAARLVRSGEEWARARTLYLVKLFAPAGSALAYSLPRMGYGPIETSYGRRI